jgi:sigma-B regulation protein RsbU (phosphoserine phosphatase)
MPRLFVYSRKGKFLQFSLKAEKITLGRSSANDIVITDPYSSNLHAFIYPSDKGYILRDNNSKNGTFLNSKRIRGEVELNKGDEILIGSTRIMFGKELSTNVEVTREGSAVTKVHKVLPLKETLKKRDISTTIREKVKEPDLETISREHRLLSAIHAVSQELILSRPEPELIEKIMELINKFLPMDRGTLMLMDGNPPQLQSRFTCVNHESLLGKRFIVSQNILKMVMDKHSSLLISDVKDDTKWRQVESVVMPNVHSAVCVPLWNNEKIMGVIYLDRIYRPEPFSEEDLELLTLIANIAAIKIEECRKRIIAIEAERIRKQLELAAQIQRNLLPAESPAFEGFDIAGYNIPTYQVGGDYFDYFHMESNRLGVTIADVSGKGPPAAFHMVSFRTRLEVEAVPEFDLQNMASRLNDFVHRRTDPTTFISFFFCELDNLSGEFKYVNAGHNPPIILRKKGKIERLESSGMCLGMFPSQKYEAGSSALQKGDIAVLFTDGITECRNKANREFDEKRFIKFIKQNAKCSAKGLLDRVFKELKLFSQGVDQRDDMTLVIIKRVASKT